MQGVVFVDCIQHDSTVDEDVSFRGNGKINFTCQLFMNRIITVVLD